MTIVNINQFIAPRVSIIYMLSKDVHLHCMTYVQMPKKKPEYRSARSHTDFLKPLCDTYATMESVEAEVINSFLNTFRDIEHIDSNCLEEEMKKLVDGRSLQTLCRTRYEYL